MKSAEIRSLFLSYFQKNGHRIVPSSRLIPDGDPTLLFTNAGMNQFKNVFLGLETRDYKRATSSQKCVRAGGKHNDLENVGFTARHHTFFEMLGNFSFGDYFKKEAIHYAWELVTKEYQLDRSRLYVTVFQDDDEAADIWHKQEGVDRERIFRFGEKDNFWRMGASGPCGPCSEIFYDFDPNGKTSAYDEIKNGTDRVVEFWNLVFMQFNESEDGKRTTLPKPSVDTGSGLERMATILQGKTSNYDNDLFQALISSVEKVTGLEYVRERKPSSEDELRNVAMRVLADHARASAFLVADGVLPSNEGRGYVLRRIMRRALRYGRNLSVEKSILPSVVERVIEEMSEAYPELRTRREHVLSTVRDEEKRFFSTLDQGIQILESEFTEMKKRGSQIVDGKFVFKLYDTFGFPADLTALMARERGFQIDEKTFERHLEDARDLARSSWKGKGLSTSEAHLIKVTQNIAKKSGPTIFTGYHGVVSDQGHVLFLSNGSNEVPALSPEQTGVIVLDRTCFYAESGGQVGDVGQIAGARGLAEVLDTTKLNDIYLHHVRVVDGEFNISDEVQTKVDAVKRAATANNHSATHLLHAALRTVLGTHVSQAGSLVAPDKLRFDFTHNKPMSAEELSTVEAMVNEEVARARVVETTIMTPKAAIAAGAMALFGEKYGEKVRVLKMGDFSMELCGGTHVDNTAQIRFFKIVSESGVSSGVRRIEAITGETAARFLMKHTRENTEARAACGLHENWQQFMQSDSRVALWVERAKEQQRLLEREIQSLKGAKINVDELLTSAVAFKIANAKNASETLHGRLVFANLEINDRALLSQISDRLRDKIQSGVVVLIGRASEDSGREGAHPIIVTVTKNLVPTLNAGKILGAVATAMGGKGGGRPDFAQGAGRDLSKVKEALGAVNAFLK